MTQLNIALISAVFLIGFVNSTKDPPYPEPLGTKHYSQFQDTSTTTAPGTDTNSNNIPGRQNTFGRSVSGDGSASSTSPNTGSGTQTTGPSGPLGNSPYSKSKQSYSGTGSTPSYSTPQTPTNNQGYGGYIRPQPPNLAPAASTANVPGRQNTFGRSISNDGSASSTSPNTGSGTQTTGPSGPLGNSPYSKGKQPYGGTGSTPSYSTPQTPTNQVSGSFSGSGSSCNCAQTVGGGVSTSQLSGVKHYVVDTTVKADWYQAVGICLSRQMTLATVESPLEQSELARVLTAAGGIQNAWLSGNDLAQTNHYVWLTTGRPITWTNWHNGEPDHLRSGTETEHCVEAINYRWEWNDNLCNNQEYFVCQYYSNP